MDPSENNVANDTAPSPTDKILASADASVKLKKYTFTKQSRLNLLKCVREVDAHLVGHGEKDKAFETVHTKFMKHIPVQVLVRHQKPTVKTLRDKLRSMICARKSKTRLNEAASGISEIVSEEDQLLDDFILEVQEAKLAKKEETQKMTQNEAKLVAAGKEIQQQALSRVRKDNQNTTKPKKRKRDEDGSWNEWMEVMASSIQDQKKMKSDELEIRKRELQLQENKWEEERIEREHRRATEQATLDLLVSLTKKLD